MSGELSNHLWQSTLFAAAAGLLTIVFRRHRASVRYWLWFAASFKFFIPFALLMSLGTHLQWSPGVRTLAAPMAAPTISQTIARFGEPFPPTSRIASSDAGQGYWITSALLGLWITGFAAIALVRFRDWLRIRAAVRSSELLDLPAPVPVRSSPGLLEPGVIGLWHPVLLLPAGINEHLTPPQLEAVLAHELCHVRRHDNLLAAIHMMVEASFWFHPLVWWVGGRLIEERESACDEEVLSLGNQPGIYAEGILNVCRMYVESPLVCVSGVTGSNLKKRIEAILSNRVLPGLSVTKKAFLLVAGGTVFVIPIFLGLVRSPSLRAQSAADATAKFEVASVKLTTDCSGGVRGDTGAKSLTKGGGVSPSPGRLHTCNTLEGLIQNAYFAYADGRTNRTLQARLSGPPVSGGPAWIRSDRYLIDAKPESAVSQEIMNGPMMQALLEDRFHLKLRRETREVPAYALSAAKGGPKLTGFQPGSCIPPDRTKVPIPPPPPGQKNCVTGFQNKGPNINFLAQGVSLDYFSRLLAFTLDRPVIEKTGITGLFDFHFEFVIDDATPKFRPDAPPDAAPPAASDPVGPSIFVAIQQLGLKLEPTRGPKDFLVVERVERPTAN